MSTFAPTVEQLLALAEACVSAARREAGGLSDDLLLQRQRELGRVSRTIEVAASLMAAEIRHRSRPELGHSGLAQKLGARTPEALVQTTTGVTSAAARRLVRVGTMASELTAQQNDPSAIVAEPWLSPVVRAVVDGDLCAETIDAIRTGLGEPTESVSMDALADAVRQLLDEAASVTVEVLAARARELRDRLDLEGVAAREEELRSRRYLRLIAQPDGMTRIFGLLDPESAAALKAAVDAATSPRRGGPRFVDPDEIKRAEQLMLDPRTTEQIALDTLVELVDVAVRTSDSAILGARRPDVRMLVTQRDFERGIGVGFIEGQTVGVSIDTARRHACDGGIVPVMFDDNGEALNLGRTQRLHNSRQRAVIAARDGGCIAPQCERPPSWSEVHHIHPFSKGGRTDVADGVLLCRHHHLMIHNNGWRIDRRDQRYWLVPPADIDPNREPIPLRTKSPALRRLLQTA